MNEVLQRKVEALPAVPGVYLFRDGAGELLYVGKARSLRERVRTYFRGGGDGRLATWFIERKVADLEVLVTRSEKEALLLENNLIKKLKPRYNLRLRDDKSFLHLRVEVGERFPRIVPTRAVRADGALYFGPYANAGALRRSLRFLRSFVPLRDCKDAEFRSRSRPCLEYEIGRCSAPCVGLVSAEEYRADVERAVAILRGGAGDLVALVKREMERAAQRLEFERAAALRDHLQSLETSLERQDVEMRGLGDLDAVGLHVEGRSVGFKVLFVRDGRLVQSASYAFETELPRDELLAEFLGRFYAGGRPAPPQVLVPDEPYGREALEEWLRERRGARVAIVSPQRGRRARLLEMAEENARLHLAASDQQRRRNAAVLERMKERFALGRAPLVIDGFDVSTTGGSGTVAACVRFVEGEPRKSGYRSFRIRSADPADEYASMREALRRRLARARDERDLPDLLLVDGGRGHWNAARGVLDELGLTAERIDLLAVAKGGRRGLGTTLAAGERDRVFRGGSGAGEELAPDQPEAQLLLRVRDEAHRFAIRHHRQSRQRRSLESELDQIPLLGPKRKRVLLERFGDLRRLAAASEEELAGLEGIGPRAAREIARHFAGGTGSAGGPGGAGGTVGD